MLTQLDLPPPTSKSMGGQALPRTGAQATRSGKTGPLLTATHQRMISLNNSQAFSPGASITLDQVPISMLDVEREKMKITRFLQTKERAGKNFADRESLIQKRMHETEKKAKDYEKRKRSEIKQRAEQLGEKKNEWCERRERVYS